MCSVILLFKMNRVVLWGKDAVFLEVIIVLYAPLTIWCFATWVMLREPPRVCREFSDGQYWFVCRWTFGGKGVSGMRQASAWASEKVEHFFYAYVMARYPLMYRTWTIKSCRMDRGRGTAPFFACIKNPEETHCSSTRSGQNKSRLVLEGRGSVLCGRFCPSPPVLHE